MNDEEEEDDKEEDDVNDEEGGEMGTTGLVFGHDESEDESDLADCSIGTGSIP